MFKNKNKYERFETTYQQGTVNTKNIIVDKETGINYLFVTSSYCGGLTPLLDENGKPIITLINEK
ncbi:DUF6440 family protein [Clostridiaceae bacterium M8S5]|nr:DUF6440 family protein [Clostridiaceae bacterium M8S5]